MVEREDNPVELNISPEKIGFIIIKAREFDVKVAPAEPDPGSNPSDDDESEVLEDYPDDATLEELTGAIDALNDDEIIDLIALACVGRGDFPGSEWNAARALATERHRPHSAAYLVGMPELGDFLEEGLAQIGYATSDIGEGHL